MKNRLKVLIVEDDEGDSKALAAEVNAHADKLYLAGELKSANEAFDFIRDKKPDAVILDLELQGGSGDGLELLDKLRSVVICPKPYVVVNTNNASKVNRISAKKLGADYEFAKWQTDYSPKMVINHLLLVMPEILGCKEEVPAPRSERQLENEMREFVQERFNELGVSVKNEGYDYLVEAVILAAKDEKQNWGTIIGAKVNKTGDAVMKAMQYAIDNTWKNGDTNNLEKYYTAPIRKERGAPTTFEFVFYYKQKLVDHFN